MRRIPFLHLVQVAPARFMLALAPGNDFKALELALRDVLDDVPQDDERERELIVTLLDKVRSLRKSKRVSMAEILIVNMDKR